MRNCAIGAMTGDHCSLGRAFGTQAVIDGGDLKVARRNFMHQHGKCQGIGAPRNCQSHQTFGSDRLPGRAEARNGSGQRISGPSIEPEPTCTSPTREPHHTGS